MKIIGDIALITSLVFSLVCLIFLKFEHKRGLGIKACVASSLFMLISSAVLMTLLIGGDFSVEYVYHNTEKTLPLIYKISAFWSGAAGSLMLWASCMSAVFLIVCAAKRRREKGGRGFLSCLAATTAIFQLGFLVALIFINNPFVRVGSNSDGFGLNPSLQSIGMVIHPPLIMISYSLVLAAFAAALAELLGAGEKERSLSGELALLAWLVLTPGIVSGGIWAYAELGWGGYWSWDAIENSALVSWLLLTAYLHTGVFRHGAERISRSRFALIAAAAFSLLFGTFIARSGVLESVHSYSNGKIKVFFIIFLVLCAAACASLLLIAARKKKNAGGSPACRISTALLVLCAAVIEVMTVSPLLGLREINITEQWYNIAFGALGTLMLAVSAVFFGIRSLAPKGKVFASVISVIAGAAVAVLPGFSSGTVYTRVLLAACTACAAAMCIGFFAQKEILNSGRSFAMFLLHLALVITAIGLLGSRGMKTEQSYIMQAGDYAKIGAHSVTYTDFELEDGAHRKTWTAVLEYNGTGGQRELRAGMELFKKKGIYSSRACIVPGAGEDFYVLLENANDNGMILLKVLISKWVSFLWAGIALAELSALFFYFNEKLRSKRKN